MLTLLIGTNRPQSRARRVADFYATILDELGAAYQFMDLLELPTDFLNTTLYHNAGRHDGFNKFIAPLDRSDKLIIIAPEYNCSIPGPSSRLSMPYPTPAVFGAKKRPS
nr:NAD(P)H-dependent oxidoreductase [Hymenobacter sp. BRD67]